MLSICIPVYNNNIVALVKELYKQCTACKIPFEIVCIDDASTLFKEENKIVSTFPEVKYSELNQNVGRAVIRNLLAEQSQYPTLLYLDSDVSIRDVNFIKKYLPYIKASTPVVVGGVAYAKSTQHKLIKLHLHYGNKRESKASDFRNQNPYSSFLTGNLLVQKTLVQEIQFLSSLKQYGHEDTLFCQELKKRSIPVVHIDNQIIHEGLEENKIFIQKQLNAVKNLHLLIQQGHDMNSVFIYRSYLQLKKYYLRGIFIFSFGLIKPIAKKALEAGRTKWLVLFDALRLHEFATLAKKNQNN